MKKLFGLNCYRYTYSVKSEYGDEMFNGVVLSKNIYQAKKDAMQIVKNRNGSLINVVKE